VRTPSGVECDFYFTDYYRGREWEECRLLARSPDRAKWTPKLCATCPVPAIRRANRCPTMILKARIRRRWLFLRRVEVEAYCTLSGQPVAEPMVGCGRCHEHRTGAKGLGLAQAPESPPEPPSR